MANKGLLDSSAIIIEAGEGKEDRMMDGSYVQLREHEARQLQEQRQRQGAGSSGDYYVPAQGNDPTDPFGVNPTQDAAADPGAGDPPKDMEPLDVADPFGLGHESP